jgi:hypothetical protein
MKYSAKKTALKSAAPVTPVIVGEIVGAIWPQYREVATAAAAGVVALWVGIANWLKNRHKVA